MCPVYKENYEPCVVCRNSCHFPCNWWAVKHWTFSIGFGSCAHCWAPSVQWNNYELWFVAASPTDVTLQSVFLPFLSLWRCLKNIVCWHMEDEPYENMQLIVSHVSWGQLYYVSKEISYPVKIATGRGVLYFLVILNCGIRNHMYVVMLKTKWVLFVSHSEPHNRLSIKEL